MGWFADNWFLILLALCCVGMMYFMHGGDDKPGDDDKYRH